MPRKVVPVSVVVKYLKTTLDNAAGLHGVMVEGEISNLRRPSSGHLYFSLKDDTSSIACVMFSSYARSLDFQVNSGDKVIITGDVSVYVTEGRMQIIVHDIKPSGIGELYLRFEALKKKLMEEGLFDTSHKKTLPRFATNIAIVTGNNTAAREDILITFQNRWPLATIHEYAAPVQGANAAPKIIQALKKADQNHHQIIILARGGGSLEDLWCFNDEALARTIYDLQTPIVTGIGHEIDTTLVDYVSDVRANTPTGAVQVAVPDLHETMQFFASYESRIITIVQNKLNAYRNAYQKVSGSPLLQRPELLLNEKMMRLDALTQKLNAYQNLPNTYRRIFQNVFQRLNITLYTSSNALHTKIQKYQSELQNLTLTALRNEKDEIMQQRERIVQNVQQNFQDSKNIYAHQVDLLDAYSPLKILQRGYSITTNSEKVINSVNNIDVGDTIQVRLDDGSLQATIDQIYKNESES